MLLNNLVKVGSGVVKVSIATVKVATPLVTKGASATVKFTRKEIALAKREATIQAALIKEDYSNMSKVISVSKQSMMDAFSVEVLPEVVTVEIVTV